MSVGPGAYEIVAALYEMRTGSRPFDGEDVAKVACQPKRVN